MKSADALDLITMLPLMAAERPQSDIGRPFQIHSEFHPAGDQPQAIEELCEAIAGVSSRDAARAKMRARKERRQRRARR
jgi:hypothetical protein